MPSERRPLAIVCHRLAATQAAHPFVDAPVARSVSGVGAEVHLHQAAESGWVCNAWLREERPMLVFKEIFSSQAIVHTAFGRYAAARGNAVSAHQHPFISLTEVIYDAPLGASGWSPSDRGDLHTLLAEMRRRGEACQSSSCSCGSPRSARRYAPAPGGCP